MRSTFRSAMPGSFQNTAMLCYGVAAALLLAGCNRSDAPVSKTVNDKSAAGAESTQAGA